MNAITDAQITAYVAARIGAFHGKRLEALEKLQLSDLLLKNPYLDIDHMTVDATDADGNAIRIKNGATRARRQIVVRALAEHGLLTIRPGG